MYYIQILKEINIYNDEERGVPAMELLLTKSDHKILSMLSDGKRILQVHAEPEQTKEEKIFVGDIYVGKVRNAPAVISTAASMSLKISMRRL